MGMDTHGLNCLRYAHRFGDFGRTMTIARHNIHMSVPRLERIFSCGVDWSKEAYCEGLLTRYMGASIVESIDNSSYENATHIHDMNQPLPEGFAEYDTVVELGTVEHVFNISQALLNMIKLCRTGGQILHVSPANNFCGHGFWQISPELFFSLYSEANGFMDTEVFVASRKSPNTWYKVHKPMPGERVPLVSRSKLYVICRTVLKDKSIRLLNVQQSDYVETWTRAAGKVAPVKLKRLERCRARFRKRISHKYFRHPSCLNPNLTRIRLTHFLK